MNTIKRALLATSVAAVGVTAFAGSGSAIFTELDTVRLEDAGYTVTGDTTDEATVLWNETGEGVQPLFRGKIHLDGVSGQCARVRMISYTHLGQEQERQFAPADDEESFCATDDGHVARSVELLGPDDTQEVKLTLQTFINDPAGGHWSNLDSATVEYGPLPSSEVLIDAGRVDFGAGTLVNGVPSEPGQITWDVETAFLIEPTLTGRFFVRGGRNQEFQVVATCYDANGDELPAGDDGDDPSDSIFPQTNGAEVFEIERNPCDDPEVAEVGVKLQVENAQTGGFDVLHDERIALPSVFPPFDIDLDPIGL